MRFCKRSCFLSYLDYGTFRSMGRSCSCTLILKINCSCATPTTLGWGEENWLTLRVGCVKMNRWAGFGWDKRSLKYKAFSHETSLRLSRKFSCGSDGSDPILSFSHGSREYEIILVCQSEMPQVITLELSNGGQKQGSRVCHLSKKKKKQFEENIVSEWDNSTEFGMRRVSGLEYRCCLSKWERAVGEKWVQAASGSAPHYSCSHHD